MAGHGFEVLSRGTQAMKRTDQFCAWKFAWVGRIIVAAIIVLALPHAAPALVMTQSAFSVPNDYLIRAANTSDKNATTAQSCADPSCMDVYSNCLNKLKDGDNDTECINKTMACQAACSAIGAPEASTDKPETKPVAREDAVEKSKQAPNSTSRESKPAGDNAKAPASSKDSDCLKKSGETSIRACTRIIETKQFNGKPVSPAELGFAYANRGTGYQNSKQYDRAISDLRKGLSLVPAHKIIRGNLVKAYRNRAEAYQDNKQDRLALADYRAALELDPNDAQSEFWVLALKSRESRASDTKPADGKASTSQKSKPEKYPFFARVQPKRPSDVSCEFGDGWRGVVDCSLLIEEDFLGGESSSKDNHFSKFPNDIRKRRKPENKAKFLAWRGGVLEDMGLNDLAIADYQLALHLDPNNADAAEALDGIGAEKKFKADDETKCFSGSPADIPLCSRALATERVNGKVGLSLSHLRIYFHANRGLAFLRLNLPELASHDFDRATHNYILSGRGVYGLPAKAIFDIYHNAAKSAERQGAMRAALRYLVIGIKELPKHPKHDGLVDKFKADMRPVYEGHRVSTMGFEQWFNCSRKGSFFDCSDPVPGDDDWSYCDRKTGGQATIDTCERVMRKHKLPPHALARIHQIIAIHLVNMKELGRAEKHCEKVATLGQSENWGKLCYGRLFEAKGQVAKAKAAYNDVLQENVYLYVDLAKRMRAMGIKPLPPYHYKSFDELDEDCYDYIETCNKGVDILDSWLEFHPDDKKALTLRKSLRGE